MPKKLIEMKGIHKQYPGVKALDDVHIDVYEGEVLGLVGENGAGKSTLMKVLTGITTKDRGTIKLSGKEINPSGPKDSQDLGIGIIHQELNLMEHLTVAQNIFIGKEPVKGFLLDNKEENESAYAMLKALNVDIDPTIPVKELTVAKQQMLEIAKALSYDSQLLVMDEPTAALTESEIQELFKVIRDLRDRGHGIVYISHRLDELPQICDRVTVMRDGQFVGTKDMKDVTKEQIISMMVGRTTIFEEISAFPVTPSTFPLDKTVVIFEVMLAFPVTFSTFPLLNIAIIEVLISLFPVTLSTFPLDSVAITEVSMLALAVVFSTFPLDNILSIFDVMLDFPVTASILPLDKILIIEVSMDAFPVAFSTFPLDSKAFKIGRASCRERV